MTQPVALVTGGASGIGAAVARRLTQSGWRVCVADIDQAAAAGVAAQLGELGLPGLGLACDVRELASLQACVRATLEQFGRLDAAHLNAGIVSGMRGVDDFDLERYRRIVGVNLDGVVLGVQAVVPALRASGGGRIVATASLAGLTATPDDPTYTATKHAVVGFVRSMAPTLAAEGIVLSAVCPGYAQTPLIAEHLDLFNAAGFPLLTADDVAVAVQQMLTEAGPGQAWFVQPGRPAAPFRFPSVPGPRAQDQTPTAAPPRLTAP